MAELWLFVAGVLSCMQASADAPGPDAGMQAIPAVPEAPVLPHMSQDCLSYLAARKISPATLLRNRVYEQHLQMSRKRPEKENAIVFPYIHNGEVVGKKTQTLNRGFSHETPSQCMWYGLDDIVAQDIIIIVEGEAWPVNLSLQLLITSSSAQLLLSVRGVDLSFAEIFCSPYLQYWHDLLLKVDSLS